MLYSTVKIINHGLQCDAFHGCLNRSLDFTVRSLQYFAAILRHRTGSSLTGMNPDEGGSTFRLQCGIDLVQGDLGRIGAQLGAADSKVCSDRKECERFF